MTSLPAYSANILLRGTIPILTALPLPVEGTHLVYFLSTDSTKVDDGCDADALQGLPLAGKVVVIQRGSCAFTDKMSNVAAAGGCVTRLSARAPSLPR